MRKNPILPLDTFREFIGFHPWHFWGFTHTDIPLDGKCNPVLMERQSQSFDRAGRDDFRQAIAQAERKMAGVVDYYPAPVFLTSEVQWPILADRRMGRATSTGADWRWLGIETPFKHVQSIGVRTLSEIQLDSPVSFVDQDSDTFWDVATLGPITLSSGVTDVKEIAVFFSAGDRFGPSTSLEDDAWRITPIYPTISGDQLTIEVRPWLLARPKLYEGMNPQPLNPKDANSFITTLDVYRLYTNKEGQTTDNSQVTLIWETEPSHGWWCVCPACSGSPTFEGSPYDPAATARAVARAGIRDSEKGLITPAEAVYTPSSGTWSALSSTWCSEPDKAVVRYLAGYPTDFRGHMDATMVEVVSFLAAAELWRPVCGCSAATRAIDYLQYDLSKVGNEKELYEVYDRVTKNLFGTRRGQVAAWERLGIADNWSGVLV